MRTGPTGTMAAHGDLDKTSRGMYPLWVRNLTLTAAWVTDLERPTAGSTAALKEEKEAD